MTWWRQSVARVPATIPHLFAYLREARKRNICLDPRRSCQPGTAADAAAKAGMVGRATGAIMAFSTNRPG